MENVEKLMQLADEARENGFTRERKRENPRP